jgi:hypothetical protein
MIGLRLAFSPARMRPAGAAPAPVVSGPPHAPTAFYDFADAASLTLGAGDAITVAADQSGNGHHATAIASPKFQASQRDIGGPFGYARFALGDGFAISDTLATNPRDCTVVTVLAAGAGYQRANQSCLVSLGSNAREFIVMKNASVNLGVYNGTTTDAGSVKPGEHGSTAWAIGSATNLHVGSDMCVWSKGAPPAVGAAVGGYIGRFTSSNNTWRYAGGMHAVLVFDRALSLAEIAKVNEWAAARYLIAAPSSGVEVIHEGDSLTFGAWSSSEAQEQQTSTPAQWQHLFAPGTSPRVVNSGVSGSLIETSGVQTIAALDGSGAAPAHRRIVVVGWGNNDIAGAKTAAQFAIDYQAYMDAVRAAHPDVEILIRTLLPTRRFGAASMDPGSLWDQYNELIRKNTGTLTHDGFLEMADIPELLDTADPVYFADWDVGQTHLTDLGYGVAAARLKAEYDAHIAAL